MQLSELAAWGAIVLALFLAVLLALQASRLGRIERQYWALMRGSGSAAPAGDGLSIAEILSRHGALLEEARTDIDALAQRLGDLDPLVARSVQHVGIVRYNPFQDTGGDQSFAIALLDARGNGIVLSSLHTRTATRFYGKPVKAGASQLSLSEEEQQAVQQAMGVAAGT
jgi:hypothetical protein